MVVPLLKNCFDSILPASSKFLGVASLRDDMQLFSIKKKYLLKAIASNLKKVKIVF
jgi:hypothetical protein